MVYVETVCLVFCCCLRLRDNVKAEGQCCHALCNTSRELTDLGLYEVEIGVAGPLSKFLDDIIVVTSKF
jgi:hypothetical protein